MSIDIIVAASGIAASAIGVLVAALSKKHLERVHEEDRNKIESEARTRLTEIGINLAGIGFSFKIPDTGLRDIAVSEKLLKDVEQGIVD